LTGSHILEGRTEARRAHAARYEQLIKDSGIKAPEPTLYARHVYHVYAVRHSRRDLLKAALGDQGVQTGIHYPIPVHMQKAYADLGYKAGDFPHSERAANEVLSLPMFPELSEEGLKRVAVALQHAVGY